MDEERSILDDGPEPVPQKHVCVTTMRFDTYGEALGERERAIDVSAEDRPSKVKIVRRGSLRTSRGQYFELKLYRSIGDERPPKKGHKRNKKGD